MKRAVRSPYPRATSARGLKVNDANFLHEFRHESETGFLYFVHNGTMTSQDATTMLSFYKEQVSAGDAGFIIADNRKAKTITSEARKVCVNAGLPGEIYLALFGGSFAFRGVAQLLFSAMKMTTGSFEGTAVVDEAEARAWLTEKRRSYLARKAR